MQPVKPVDANDSKVILLQTEILTPIYTSQNQF